VDAPSGVSPVERDRLKQGEISMLDLFYLVIGLVGFVALWGITKFCDRV